MIYRSVLFAILAVFKITYSLPVKEKIASVDLKYYCVKISAPDEKVQDQTPVLLIHGLGGSHKSWDGVNILLSLRAQRKVCSVDLRNHGDSPWNKRTDFKAMAADIGHFLDEQGIKKVNIIGHSLGGKIAVHYTLNNPNRVNSIVVEDFRPNGVVKEFFRNVVRFFEILREAISKVPAGVTEHEAREGLVNFLNKKKDQLGVTEKFSTRSISFLELKLVDDKWHFKHNIDVLLKALKDPDTLFGKSTGVYKGRALFIYGDKSPAKVGEDKENIQKFFPNVKLVRVEGANHIIHGEFREFDNEVVKFLNEANL